MEAHILVRADGSPKFSMYCNLVGAIINVILDYLFVMRFGWGMSGAALATVIGQIVSFMMVSVVYASLQNS